MPGISPFSILSNRANTQPNEPILERQFRRTYRKLRRSKLPLTVRIDCVLVQFQSLNTPIFSQISKIGSASTQLNETSLKRQYGSA
jgi:hypothetical protein